MVSAQAVKKAISDPTRLRILELFSQKGEWTAKEMAQALGLTPNGLYYHLRILEEAERIAVIGSRAGDRMVERLYGNPNEDPIQWSFTEPLELSIHLGAILEAARARADEAIYDKARRLEQGEEFEDIGYLTFNAPAFTTTADEVKELDRKIQAVIQEFRDRARKIRTNGSDSELVRMRLAYVLHDESRLTPASATTQ